MEEITVTKDGTYQKTETKVTVEQGHVDTLEFKLISLNDTINNLNERLVEVTAERDAVQTELDTVRQKVAEANGKANWAELKAEPVEVPSDEVIALEATKM